MMASKRKRLSVHDIDHSYNKSTVNLSPTIKSPPPSIITSSSSTSSSSSSSVSSPLIPSLSPFLSPQLLMSPVMLDHPKASFKKRLLRKASTTSSNPTLSEHSYHQDCRPITVPILEHSQKDTDSELLKNPRNGNVVIFDYSRPYVLTYSKQAKKLAKCLIANNDAPEERQQPPPPPQPVISSSVMPNSITKPAEECLPPIVKTEPLESETISKLSPPSLVTSFENEPRPQPPPSKPKKSVLEEEHSYHVSKSPPSMEQVTSSSAPETVGSMNSRSISRCIRSTFIDHQHCHGTSMDDNGSNGFDEPPEDTTSLNAMDEAFGRYVISCLRGMTPAKRNQARIKIVKVLNQSI